MEEYFVVLQENMEDEINRQPNEDRLLFYNVAKRIVVDTIKKLATAFSGQLFAEPELEIFFYKFGRPGIYQYLIYYNSLVSYEGIRRTMSKESFCWYIRNTLSGIERYIGEHSSLYAYYISGGTNLDGFYFSSRTDDDESVGMGIARGLMESIKISHFMAYEKLVPFFRREYDTLSGLGTPESEATGLRFLGKKAALVELASILVASKAFNNSEKEIVEVIERVTNTDLRNYRVIKEQNFMRKKDPFPFMSLLNEAAKNMIRGN